MRIVLVIHDYCLTPNLSNTENEIKVTIGIGHNFDEILDVVSGALSNEQINLLHRLWADDSFPRNFQRIGDELIITSRE
jgi:hypothetical protein